VEELPEEETGDKVEEPVDFKLIIPLLQEEMLLYQEHIL
jgi:hypothetical protein